MLPKGKRPTSTGSEGRAASELANIFEQMMQQLTLLGHTLSQAAVSFTPQQLKILFTLDFLAEPTPMSKLSAQLGVTPGTLTKTAAGLVRKGYLKRRRSADDERVVRISLSKEGERIVWQIKKYRQGFFREICDKLTLPKRRKLIASHRHILETYRRILEEKRRP